MSNKRQSPSPAKLPPKKEEKPLLVPKEHKMLFYILKWVFNAIKIDDSKGAFVTKEELLN